MTVNHIIYIRLDLCMNVSAIPPCMCLDRTEGGYLKGRLSILKVVVKVEYLSISTL